MYFTRFSVIVSIAAGVVFPGDFALSPQTNVITHIIQVLSSPTPIDTNVTAGGLSKGPYQVNEVLFLFALSQVVISQAF